MVVGKESCVKASYALACLRLSLHIVLPSLWHVAKGEVASDPSCSGMLQMRTRNATTGVSRPHQTQQPEAPRLQTDILLDFRSSCVGAETPISHSLLQGKSEQAGTAAHDHVNMHKTWLLRRYQIWCKGAESQLQLRLSWRVDTPTLKQQVLSMFPPILVPIHGHPLSADENT